MGLENKFVEISLPTFNNQNYSGYCIKETSRIFILINYNTKIKSFDGFTVFNTSEIDAYREWAKGEIGKIKKDNRKEIISLFNFNKALTFYSCLKLLIDNYLIAFFTDNNTKEYYVAKVTGLSKSHLILKLIDQNGKWLNSKAIKLSDINYFSFLTKYEEQLNKKIRN